MDAGFWHTKWAKNEIGFHLSDANPLLVKHFNNLKLTKGQRVFLPLCGKTLDIGWLVNAGFKVVGIELNEGAVQSLFNDLSLTAKVTKLDKLRLYSADNIEIFVGDFFDLTAETLGPVDAIYDRAAIVALPTEMRLRYVSHLKTITQCADQLIINYHYDQTQLNGPPFSVSNDELKQHYSSYYQMDLLEQLSVEGGLRGSCPATENVWLLTQLK